MLIGAGQQKSKTTGMITKMIIIIITLVLIIIMILLRILMIILQTVRKSKSTAKIKNKIVISLPFCCNPISHLMNKITFKAFLPNKWMLLNLIMLLFHSKNRCNLMLQDSLIREIKISFNLNSKILQTNRFQMLQ